MIVKLAFFTSILLYIFNIYKSEKKFQYQENPVIGIFSQPSTFAEYPKENYTYIAASYVKFLESGGARVIPIPYDANYTVLDQIFENINGILIPGGSTGLKGPSFYSKQVAYLVNKAIKLNNNGGWFPIIGICLGHELLHYILSNYSSNFLIDVTGQDKVTKSLNILNRNYNFYSQMNDKLFQATQNWKLAYYHHIYAVSPTLYEESPILKDYLKITSTQYDDDGKLFITSTDGIIMPIYTFQYHPEKNPFEWTVPANHSKYAIQFSRVHSQQFVEACRLNNNKFNLQNSTLIYNYNPIKPANKVYSQVYIFNRLTQLEADIEQK